MIGQARGQDRHVFGRGSLGGILGRSFQRIRVRSKAKEAGEQERLAELLVNQLRYKKIWIW